MGTDVRMKRLWLALVSLFLVVLPAHDEGRSKFAIVLPDKYSGWICVQFGVPGAAPLPIKNGTLIIRPLARGILQTSTPQPGPLSSADIFFDRGGKRVSAPKEWRVRYVSRECPGSESCIFFGTEEDWNTEQDTPDNYSRCGKAGEGPHTNAVR